jgi:hypothetical protein
LNSIGVGERAAARVDRPTAPEHGADPSDQLVEAERLRDIVVAPLGEAAEPVLGRVARGQEDDGHVASGRPQRAAHLEAVDTGQAHVEDDQVGSVTVERSERLRPVRHDAGGESGEAQRAGDKVADVLLVVDDENGRVAHARNLIRAPYETTGSLPSRAWEPSAVSVSTEFGGCSQLLVMLPADTRRSVNDRLRGRTT